MAPSVALGTAVPRAAGEAMGLAQLAVVTAMGLLIAAVVESR